MKLKILLVTSLYPVNNQTILHNTNVCHYFAREWVKMGYEVRVIFNYNVYPKIFYFLNSFIGSYVGRFSGKAIFGNYLKSRYDYEIDGIKITQLPIFKSKPGGLFKKKQILKQVDMISDILIDEDFKPDCMLGHVIHPNIEILSKLKGIYIAPTCITLHGVPSQPILIDDLRQMDFIGFRSLSIKKAFEMKYGSHYNSFLCYSGVPESYIARKKRDWSRGANRFLYVGNLIRRKHPKVIIPAVTKVYKTDNYSITYIGSGGEDNAIRTFVKNHSLEHRVHLKGQLDRKDILNEYDNADVFVMISEDEAFGLVYIEAMARGCIVVASRNEGMDGIIKDGENGFLCKAGDEAELSKVLKKIKSMNHTELELVSDKAVATAEDLTDRLSAQRYIQHIL